MRHANAMESESSYFAKSGNTASGFWGYLISVSVPSVVAWLVTLNLKLSTICCLFTRRCDSSEVSFFACKNDVLLCSRLSNEFQPRSSNYVI